jgi:hypothetical protein
MLKSRCPGAAARGRGIKMRPWRLTVFHSSSVSVWRSGSGEKSSSWSESFLESTMSVGGGCLGSRLGSMYMRCGRQTLGG